MMPTSAPPPTEFGPVDPPKLPGRAGIWVGVALIIGGIVLGIVLVVAGVRSLVTGFDDLSRVSIRSGGTVLVEDTGQQKVFAERPAVGGGTSFQTGNFLGTAPSVQISVTGPDGSPVIFVARGPSETYTVDGTEGVLLGWFNADAPGEYRIDVSGGEFAQPYQSVAVGQGFDVGGVFSIIGGVFAGGFIVLIGIIVMIVFAVRRGNAKRRAQVAAGDVAPGWIPPGSAPGWVAPPAAGPWGGPPAPGPPGAAPYGAPSAPPYGTPGYGATPMAPPPGATPPGWAAPPPGIGVPPAQAPAFGAPVPPPVPSAAPPAALPPVDGPAAPGQPGEGQGSGA